MNPLGLPWQDVMGCTEDRSWKRVFGFAPHVSHLARDPSEPPPSQYGAYTEQTRRHVGSQLSAVLSLDRGRTV